MTKSDLKTGMRVKLRNGKVFVVLRGFGEGFAKKFYSEFIICGFENGFMFDDDYNYDLTISRKLGDKDTLDIVEVYAAPELSCILDKTYPVVSIWKREEKHTDEPLEITIEEIAELKGVSPDRIRIKEA